MKYNNVAIQNKILQELKNKLKFTIISSEFIPVGEESYAYLVTTDRGENLFVKYCDHKKVIGNFQKINKLLSELKYLNFVIPPIATSGKITIYPYIEGGVIHMPNDEFGKELVDKLTKIMAQIHNAKRNVDLPKEQFENDFQRRFNKLTASIKGSIVEDLWKNNNALLKSIIDKQNTFADIFKSKKPEFVLTHGDITGLNIIRSKSGLKLTDWDGAMFAPKERDFMFLIGNPHFSLEKYLKLTGQKNYDEDLKKYYSRDWALNSIIGNFESIVNKNINKTCTDDYINEINLYLSYYK